VSRTLSGSASSTGQVSGFGAFIGQLTNSDTIIASGGTLDVTGSVTGTGALQIANNAILRLDAAPAVGQSISFGTGDELILNPPGSGFSNAITSLNTGDKIEFGNGMTIASASVVNGNTIAVNFHGSNGLPGTYDLTNVGFAADSGHGFSVGLDSSAGDSFVQAGTAPPSTPDLLATSDSGVSNTDNTTNVTTPTFTGTAEANATVTRFDGATVVGTDQANGIWSVATGALTAGVHAITR
jgi:hypothetical protein